MKLNKPKFWDFKKTGILSSLLIPFTIFIQINNFIILNYKKFKSPKIKSICIGNIYVGGTGKTPLTIKIFKIISKFCNNIVVAKKFYSSHNDEIILLNKYTKLIHGQNRLLLLKKIIKRKFKVVIFDDGLQDKKIDYDLKFVCFDSKKWIGNGNLLPSGPLRADINIIKNYDAVFLKNIYQKNNKAIKIIKSINPSIKIFNYNIMIKDKNRYNLSRNYFAFSGIGNSDSFLDLLKYNNFKIIKNVIFPDHYMYSILEIEKIINHAKLLKAQILTTEKDYVKLPKKYLNKFKCLKIDLNFDNKKELVSFLRSKINE